MSLADITLDFGVDTDGYERYSFPFDMPHKVVFHTPVKPEYRPSIPLHIAVCIMFLKHYTLLCKESLSVSRHFQLG
jgi:hypothetical protein